MTLSLLSKDCSLDLRKSLVRLLNQPETLTEQLPVEGVIADVVIEEGINRKGVGERSSVRRVHLGEEGVTQLAMDVGTERTAVNEFEWFVDGNVPLGREVVGWLASGGVGLQEGQEGRYVDADDGWVGRSG